MRLIDMPKLIIHPDRISADIEAIAAFSEVPADVGHSRPTFGDAWRAATQYVIAQAQRAGCNHRTDAAGNVHIRPAGVPWEARVWLSGSHLDSVPTGGKYDGVMGVVVPLEVLRAAHDAGRGDLPLELICFAEEEGTTFGIGMIGSRLWTAAPAADFEGFKNRDGNSFFKAGAAYGVDAQRLADDQVSADAYIGFVEVHAEQGRAMWDAQQAVAVVTAINGRRQYAVTLTGEANHAGSTRMRDRRDALAGAAEVMTMLEQFAASRNDATVITVGQINARPNAINVIPGEVTFTIDFRASCDFVLRDGDAQVRKLLADVAGRRGVKCACRQTESLSALPMDAGVVAALQRAARAVRAASGDSASGDAGEQAYDGPNVRTGQSSVKPDASKINSAAVDLPKAANATGDPATVSSAESDPAEVSLPQVASGALHDAAVLAPVLPTAMLFVASDGGISHNPAELSRIQDIAQAARVLAEVVAR